MHQMALSLFRFIAAVGRSMVVANLLGMLVLLVVFVFGGFVIAKGFSIMQPCNVEYVCMLFSHFITILILISVLADDIRAWWAWAYWASPMMYAQNAVAVNEFLDDRWGTVSLLAFTFLLCAGNRNSIFPKVNPLMASSCSPTPIPKSTPQR